MGKLVLFLVDDDAELLEPRDRLRPYGGGHFADSRGEHKGVHMAECGVVGTDVLLDPVAFHVLREGGAGVACVDVRLDVATVGPLFGDAEKAGLLVQCLVHLLGGHASLAHDVEGDGRVAVSRPGSHDKALERGEAHRGVEGAAVLDGVDRRAVPDVGDDEVRLEGILAEEDGGALGRVEEGRSVEAVPAHGEFLVPFVGQGVEVAFGGHGLMPGCVDDRGMGNVGKDGLCRLDSHDVCRVVQGAEILDFPEGVDHLLGHEDRFGELAAAVQDAMPDRLDDVHVLDDPGLGIGEGLDDELDRDLVVRALVLGRILGFSLRLVVDERSADGNPLDDAVREYFLFLPVVYLILDRGAAAVEGQYDHEILRYPIKFS